MAPLTTYTFNTPDYLFAVDARSRVDALVAANDRVRIEGIDYGSYAWFDGVDRTSFHLGRDVFLD